MRSIYLQCLELISLVFLELCPGQEICNGPTNQPTNHQLTPVYPLKLNLSGVFKPNNQPTGKQCGRPTLVVSSNEAQDVFMPQHHGLVDLRLPEPRPLVSTGEDLHGDTLTLPLAHPDLPVPTFTQNLHQLYLSSDGALNEKRQTWNRKE